MPLDSVGSAAQKLPIHKEATSQRAPANEECNPFSTFLQSTVYSAVEQPLRGLAQAVDQAKGTHLDQSILSGFGMVAVSPTKPAEFGTINWYSQQLGSAVGMVLPYLLLHKGIKCGAGKIFGEEAVFASQLELTGRKALAKSALRESGLSAATGFVYGAALTPTDDKNSTGASFLKERFYAGAGSAASFGAMGMVNPYVSKSLTEVSAAMESAPAKSAAGAVAKVTLSNVLKGPVLPGVAAGLPGGAINAEVDAWKQGKAFASAEEFKESMISMSFVGGALGGTHWLGAQHEGTDRTNARALTDRVGLTHGGDTLPETISFKLLGHPGGLDKLQTGIASGAGKAAETVSVRQQLRGLSHGLFGLPISTLGDARTMLLNHQQAGDRPLTSANGASLIATCAALETGLRGRDVFPQRSVNGNSAPVWLERAAGSNRFALSLRSADVSTQASVRSLVRTRLGSWSDDADDPSGAENYTLGALTKYAGAETARRIEALDKTGEVLRTITGKMVFQEKSMSLAVKALVDSGATASEFTEAHLNNVVRLVDMSGLARTKRILALQQDGLNVEDVVTFMQGYSNERTSRDPRTRRREEEFRATAAKGSRGRIALVGKLIDDNGTAEDINPNRLQALRDLSQYFLKDAATLDKLKGFEHEGLNVSNLAEYLSNLMHVDRARKGLVKSLVEEGVSAHQLDSLAVVNQPDLVYPPLSLKRQLPGTLASACELQDLPAWKQAAARMAWRAATEATPPRAKSRAADQDAFWTNFHALVAGGRQALQAEASHPTDSASILEGPYMPVNYGKLLHVLALKDADEPSRSGALIRGLNPGVFKAAMRELQPDFDAKPEQPYSAMTSAIEASEMPASALKLSLIFDKTWSQWLGKQAALGRDAHDATYWLPLDEKAKVAGLGDYLLKNANENIEDLKTVASHWTDLEPVDRKLPTTELARKLRLKLYGGAQSEAFAPEAQKWGVRESKYSEYENRFLHSFDLSLPFPIERVWKVGELTGRFLPRTDPRALFIGKYTDCCQYPDGAGSASAWYSQTSPNAGVFVVEDAKGQVVAESWAWVSDNGGLCFDNVEAQPLNELQDTVRQVYQNAANDLSSSFHTVTVGTLRSDLNLAGLPPAGANTLPLPGDYKGNYDSEDQVLLAANKKLPKQKVGLASAWVKGVDTENEQMQAVRRIARAAGGQEMAELDKDSRALLLMSNEGTAEGYAIVNGANRIIQDIEVTSNSQEKAAVLVNSLINMSEAGAGRWRAYNLSESAYKAFEDAAAAGRIAIVGEGEMSADSATNGKYIFFVRK